MKIGKRVFDTYHYRLHFFIIILRGVETEHQRHKRRKHQQFLELDFFEHKFVRGVRIYFCLDFLILFFGLIKHFSES